MRKQITGMTIGLRSQERQGPRRLAQFPIQLREYKSGYLHFHSTKHRSYYCIFRGLDRVLHRRSYLTGKRCTDRHPGP